MHSGLGTSVHNQNRERTTCEEYSLREISSRQTALTFRMFSFRKKKLKLNSDEKFVKTIDLRWLTEFVRNQRMIFSLIFPSFPASKRERRSDLRWSFFRDLLRNVALHKNISLEFVWNFRFWFFGNVQQSIHKLANRSLKSEPSETESICFFEKNCSSIGETDSKLKDHISLRILSVQHLFQLFDDRPSKHSNRTRPTAINKKSTAKWNLSRRFDSDFLSTRKIVNKRRFQISDLRLSTKVRLKSDHLHRSAPNEINTNHALLTHSSIFFCRDFKANWSALLNRPFSRSTFKIWIQTVHCPRFIVLNPDFRFLSFLLEHF